MGSLTECFASQFVAFRGLLLSLYNDSWEQGEMPLSWRQTLISYIYKGKGHVNELTSYRPIALTSAICNVFKAMMLKRLVFKLADQIHHSQGG